MSDQKTILVVEDEKPLAYAISEKLQKEGYKTFPVRSVKEAVDILESEKIDAIWLDHYLLGKDSGLDLVIKVKQEDSEWKDIPIYVVSNTATEDKVKQYLKFGVKDYFVKAESKLELIIGEIKSDLE